MSTSAQAAANQANAQLSTGPTTPAGQAIVRQNNFRHGFTGSFKVLPWEKQQDFRDVLAKLCTLHQPQDEGEIMPVEKMAQHYFLTQRALTRSICATTHDRAFHKCADELRKVRNEKRKWQIGFASQKRNKAADEHNQLNENRKQELHKWAVMFAEARFTHQRILTIKRRGAPSAVRPRLRRARGAPTRGKKGRLSIANLNFHTRATPSLSRHCSHT